MSFSHDSPWPSSTTSGASDETHHFFPSVDRDDPSSSSSPSTSHHPIIQINPGSTLPRHAPSPPPHRLRAITSPSTRTRTISSLPMTSSTKIVKSAPNPSIVKTEEVWREILKTSYGRDKAFKIIQYTMRLFLLLHGRSLGLMKRPRGGEVVRRMNLAVSNLGLTRKCLLLFNWLTPLIQITHPTSNDMPFTPSSNATLTSPTLMHRFLHAPPPVLLDLCNNVADDIATTSKLGLLGPGVGRRAGRMADWFWFASTLAGLVEVGAERAMVKGMIAELEARIYDGEMEKSTNLAVLDEDEEELRKLKYQYGWLKVSRMKLFMDLIFVSYEVFKIQRASASVKTTTGLLSAILSSYKMYDKHRGVLLKSSTYM